MAKWFVFLLFFFPCVGNAVYLDDVAKNDQLEPLNVLDDHFYHYRMLLIETIIFDIRQTAHVRGIYYFDHSLDLLEFLLGNPQRVSENHEN